MIYEQLKQRLRDYNWDDGFDLPKQILSDESCDLAIALEIFYLGDGFSYFQAPSCSMNYLPEWNCFIRDLYEKITNGAYQKAGHPYAPPLSKVQRYQMRKKGIPDIFLEDLL